MMRNSRPRSWTIASIATLVVIVTAAAPRRADARDCVLTPNCDFINPACWVCTDDPSQESDISGWEAGNQDHPLRPEFNVSDEAKRAAEVWRQMEQGGFSRVPDPHPARSVSEDTAARERAAALLRDQIFRDRARTGRADYDEVLEICRPPAGLEAVEVPRDQGGPRDVSPSGDPRSSGAEATKLDPVDPLTGELIVEHVDLALPSFGVPFSHRRVYRSRVTYDGPLGPGWDFTYNQRLVEAPAREQGAGLSVTGTGRYGIPLGDAHPEEMAEDPTSPCGPVLLLTTGTATTLRFRERARAGDTISYESDAADLSLIGHASDDGISWELRSRFGDVRRFDGRGHLVAWHDPNGIGLQFSWGEGTVRDWRLAAVNDSVGRTFEYRYDETDRLRQVTESTSGLSATYAYDEHGALERAVRSDGKAENYEYDVQVGRDLGDWIPERMLEATCEMECSVSGASCDAGGACDKIVADVTGQCLDACPACAAECTAGCEPGCRDACDAGPEGCPAQCDRNCSDPVKLEEIEDNCEAIYDDENVDDFCRACSARCELVSNSGCNVLLSCIEVSGEGVFENVNSAQVCEEWALLSSDGLVDGLEDLFRTLYAVIVGLWDLLGCLDGECNWDNWWENIDQLCDDDVSSCCTTGQDCSQDSCNRNLPCETACQNTFLGKAMPGNCPAPETPFHCLGRRVPSPRQWTEYENYLADCGGTTSDWAQANGCIPSSIAACEEGCEELCRGTCVPACTGSCAATCATECHVADCATYCVGLDLPGQCRDACTTACVDEFHARGPFVGPKYGYSADLQFNLIRVYDGNGNLYLENTYGTDIASPDFDTVVLQRFGEHTGEMNHVDLAHGAQGTASWASMIVESRADYDAPAICHYGCEPAPPDPRDLAVPWNEVILVFGGGTGTSEAPAGGWYVKTTAKSPLLTLAPTYVALAPDGTGRLTPRSAKGALDAGASLAITLPTGKVTLAISSDGSVASLGTKEAVSELVAAGGVTLFGDGMMLRAYPGSPKSVVAVTEGKCSRPFHIERVGAEELAFEPKDACSGDLWIAPIASRASDLDVATYQTLGQKAILTSHFLPSSVSPVRGATTLSAGFDGRYKRSPASSKSAIERAAKLGLGLYGFVPLLSAPLDAPPEAAPEGEPIFVYHQSKSDDTGTYPPPSPPSDVAWADQDTPDRVFDPPCDPQVPGPPVWGTGESGAGAKPAHATAVRDLHGARWTLYADEAGRLIRQVNHETGASRWWEYDPDGRVTGVLEPDGARQCLKYDAQGNVTELLSLPAFDPNLVTPDPVRNRFAWTAWPSRLAVIMDPRDPSRELRRMEYDTAGNLRSITEIDGMRTSVTPVGGSSAARAMPAAIVSPDGAITQISYDLSNGTVRRVVRDATGASPVIAEVQSDAAGRPTWTTSPLGLVEGFEWDGPLLSARTWDADGLERREDYAYDDDAQLVNVAGARKQTEVSYDAIGAATSTTDTAMDGSLPSATRCRRNGPNGRVL